MTVAFFKQGINKHGFMAGVDAVWLFFQRVGIFLLAISLIVVIITMFTFDPRKELLKIYERDKLEELINDEGVETFVRKHTEKYVPPSKVTMKSIVETYFH